MAARILLGCTRDFLAGVTPWRAADGKGTWSVDDATVAPIIFPSTPADLAAATPGFGRLKGSALGSTSVHYTFRGQTATVAVQVVGAPDKVFLTPGPVRALEVGDRVFFTSTAILDGVYFGGAGLTAWAVSDPAVATLGPEMPGGAVLLKAVGVGRATVTATIGGVSATALVEVPAGPTVTLAANP